MRTKIWNQPYSLPKDKKKAYTDRAKRSGKELIELGKAHGLEVKFDWVAKGLHVVLDKYGNGVHNDYGVCGTCYNYKEVEEVLEEYIKANSQ